MNIADPNKFAMILLTSQNYVLVMMLKILLCHQFYHNKLKFH